MTQLTFDEAAHTSVRDILDKDEVRVSGDGFNYKIVVTIEESTQQVQQITGKPVPIFGSANGRIKIADDFDRTPEGFEPYMP